MWCTDYIKEIKRQFYKKYKFKPSRIVGDDYCFDDIPDGDYPMKIKGKIDYVKIIDGTIECCNWKKKKLDKCVIFQ